MADLDSNRKHALNPVLRWLQAIVRVLARLTRPVAPPIAVAIERVAAAVLAFWSALLDPHYGAVPRAAAQSPVRERGPAPARPAAPTAPTASLDKAPPDSALLLLGLLQKEGRLVDFLQEDVSQYSDAEVGAAARVVHQGCRAVLTEYLSIVPVRAEPEGSQITVPPGFDASEIRLTGNLVGAPPFTGSLAHRGWRATAVRLPQVASGRDLRILAAAEVDL